MEFPLLCPRYRWAAAGTWDAPLEPIPDVGDGLRVAAIIDPIANPSGVIENANFDYADVTSRGLPDRSTSCATVCTHSRFEEGPRGAEGSGVTGSKTVRPCV
jgi:hypothetical protein